MNYLSNDYSSDTIYLIIYQNKMNIIIAFMYTIWIAMFFIFFLIIIYILFLNENNENENEENEENENDDKLKQRTEYFEAIKEEKKK